MPTPTKGPRLGGGPAHERLLLANLATALFEHRTITTTEAKAKRLRPLAERLITFAKRGDLHARRRVLTVVRDKGVVHTLFTEIAPAMGERHGGYTRIVKIGPRKGDNAPMAVIDLVLEPVRGARRPAPQRAAAQAPAAPAAAGSPADADAKGAAAEDEAADRQAAAESAAEKTDAEKTDAEAGEPAAAQGAPSTPDSAVGTVASGAGPASTSAATDPASGRL